jgi:hypothetical protein
MIHRIILLIACALIAVPSFSQYSPESEFHKWGVSAHLGANTVSTNSSNASFLNYNWSLGVIRNFKTKSDVFRHYLKFKAQAFNEKLSNLPYYSLDANDNLVASTYTSKSFYSMIYVGWGTKYVLATKSKAFSIRGGLGFNYMLPARYTSIHSDGSPKGTQSYGRPYNFFFTRPEIAVGLGYKLNLGNSEMILSPFYSYNFTIRYLNLVPSFHTAGIEIIYNF